MSTHAATIQFKGRWNVTRELDYAQRLTKNCNDSPPTVSIPVGQWMKVQGKFKMQAHRSSTVVMDIAAFKVCHSGDKEATALQEGEVKLQRGTGRKV